MCSDLLVLSVLQAFPASPAHTADLKTIVWIKEDHILALEGRKRVPEPCLPRLHFLGKRARPNIGELSIIEGDASPARLSRLLDVLQRHLAPCALLRKPILDLVKDIRTTRSVVSAGTSQVPRLATRLGLTVYFRMIYIIPVHADLQFGVTKPTQQAQLRIVRDVTGILVLHRIVHSKQQPRSLHITHDPMTFSLRSSVANTDVTGLRGGRSLLRRGEY